MVIGIDKFSDYFRDLPHDDFLKGGGISGYLTVRGILDIIKRSFLL